MKPNEKKVLSDFSDDLKNVNTRSYFIAKYLGKIVLLGFAPIIIYLNLNNIVIVDPKYFFFSDTEWVAYLLNKNDGATYGPAFVSSFSILLFYILLATIKFLYVFKKPYTSLTGTQSEKFQTIIFRLGFIFLTILYVVLLIPLFGILLFSSTIDFNIWMQAAWYFLMCLTLTSAPFRILLALNRYPKKIEEKYNLSHHNHELHAIFKQNKMFPLFKLNHKQQNDRK